MTAMNDDERTTGGEGAERKEIERIKGLLRDMIHDARCDPAERFFGASGILKSGKDLIKQVDDAVGRELAEIADADREIR